LPDISVQCSQNFDCRQAFIKTSNTEFKADLSSGSRVDECGWTYRHDEANRRLFRLLLTRIKPRGKNLNLFAKFLKTDSKAALYLTTPYTGHYIGPMNRRIKMSGLSSRTTENPVSVRLAGTVPVFLWLYS